MKRLFFIFLLISLCLSGIAFAIETKANLVHGMIGSNVIGSAETTDDTFTVVLGTNSNTLPSPTNDNPMKIAVWDASCGTKIQECANREYITVKTVATLTLTIKSRNADTPNCSSCAFAEGAYFVVMPTAGTWSELSLIPNTYTVCTSGCTYTTLNAAITGIGSNVARLIIDGAITLTDTIASIPSTMEVEFTRNGSITFSTYNITSWAAPLIVNPFQKIFNYNSTGKLITFTTDVTKEMYPQWWGAKGDGNTNDTIPIQAMLDLAAVMVGTDGMKTPTVLYFPAGQYKITSTLTYNPANSNGYTVFRGEYTKSMIFDYDLETLLLVGGASANLYNIVIESLFFAGVVNDSATFSTVKLIRPFLTRIKNCYFQGGASALEIDSGTSVEISGIETEGTRGALDTSGAVYINGNSHSPGSSYVMIRDSFISGSKTNGIRVEDSSAVFIDGNSFGSVQKGVLIDNSANVTVKNNNFRIIGNQLQPDLKGKGIESINNSTDIDISNNYFNGAMDYAIYDGSDSNGGNDWNITNNKILNVINGIFLGTDVDYCKITENHISNCTTQGISYSGINNFVSNNHFEDKMIRAFSTGDATPSVMLGDGTYYTANASPTTITMFHDGFKSQKIKVIIQDVNTTIDFTGTNLKGNRGADWHPTTLDWLDCSFDGTNWYCLTNNYLTSEVDGSISNELPIAGYGIDISGSPASTVDFDPTEITNGGSAITWDDGTDPTILWTWNVSTGTDPIITFGNNYINISTGAFQVGGSAVLTTANIASSISDSDTTHCPDGNSVFDALAGKQASGSYATGTGTCNGTNTGDQAWGGITGTLSSQTDLQTALNGKMTIVNPVGSVSDWVSDVTNIQAAINLGKEVHLGTGDFYLNASSGQILLITSAIKMLGEGMSKTNLIIKDGMSTSVDIIKIDIAARTDDLEIGGFKIKAQTTGSARGQHAINIDTVHGGPLFTARIHNIWFPAAGDISGNDIYYTDSSDTYLFGNSDIDHNVFSHGIYLHGIGDDFRIHQNHFMGNNIGCNVDRMIPGSANFHFYENSAQVSNTVFKGNGLGFHIFHNGLETVAGTGGTAVVWLTGGYVGGSYDDRSSIEDNGIIYAYSGTHSHAVYLQNNQNTLVKHNNLTADSGSTTYKDLIVADTCTNIRVDRDNTFVNSQVSDTGSRIVWAGCNAGANQIVFGTTCGGSANFTYDTGILTLGHTVPVGLRLGETFEINKSANYNGMAMNTWSATAGEGNILDFNRSKSATIGTQAALTTNDSVGFIIFRGSDGAAFQNMASIGVYVDNSVSAGVVPGKFKINVTNASGVDTQKFVIDSAGNFYMYGIVSDTGTESMCYDTATGLVKRQTSNSCLASARKYKLDINPYIGGLDVISQINPVTYKYKTDTERERIGLIADDLPDNRMKEFNDNGELQNFDDRAITATMINAIKELKIEIDELKQKCGN